MIDWKSKNEKKNEFHEITLLFLLILTQDRKEGAKLWGRDVGVQIWN